MMMSNDVPSRPAGVVLKDSQQPRNSFTRASVVLVVACGAGKRNRRRHVKAKQRNASQRKASRGGWSNAGLSLFQTRIAAGAISV